MAQGMLKQAQQTTGGEGLGHELRHLPQETPRWGQLQRQARTVVGNDVPTVQCRAHMARQATIRRHQGGLVAVLQGLAQPQRDGEGLLAQPGGLQQGQSLRGAPQVTQGRTLRQPGIRHRRRAQRQGHQAVAGRGDGTDFCPGLYCLGVHPEDLQQLRKPLLGVVLQGMGWRGWALLQPGPHRSGQIEVEPRQHQRPLFQAGHGLHQQPGAASGAGGARHNHRVAGGVAPPVVDQFLDHPALSRPDIQAADGLEILLHKAEERAGALPVAREFPHVQLPDHLGINTLVLEFVHEAGQAPGQGIAAGAGCQIRLLLQQLANKSTQLQLAAQGRDRGGQQQGLGPVAVVGGHQVDGGQQARGGALKELRQSSFHAPAVHHQVNPGQGFWRLSMETFPQPCQQGLGEVHPWRQAIDPWRSRWLQLFKNH